MLSGVLFQIVIGVIVLGILIFVHELGHFLFAKLFRVGVLEFAIGFGKVIWSKTRGETRYSVRAIPLGGYVRMVGDDPRKLAGSSEEDEAGPGYDLQQIGELNPQQRAMLDDRSRWLLEKSYWPKFLIVFGGPLFNILFAWILAVGIFAYYGEEKPLKEARLGDLFPGHPAEKAGLEAGDLIVSMNGERVKNWKSFARRIRSSDGETLNIDVIRGNEGKTERLTFAIEPQLESSEVALITGSKGPAYVIGVQPAYQAYPVTLTRALKLGTMHVIGLSALSVKSVYWLIKGAVSPANISGPISIVKAAAKSAERGLERLFLFMIFLSVSLAVLNLLPIPVLDGGHIVFFTIEALMGRRLSLKLQERAGMVGMAFLLSLMVFAIGNDLWRLFD